MPAKKMSIQNIANPTGPVEIVIIQASGSVTNAPKVPGALGNQPIPPIVAINTAGLHIFGLTPDILDW
jgi:hypothetical protein